MYPLENIFFPAKYPPNQRKPFFENSAVPSVSDLRNFATPFVVLSLRYNQEKKKKSNES